VGIGGMLPGAAKPVHVLSATATVRRTVNLTPVLVAGAGRSVWWAVLHFQGRDMEYLPPLERSTICDLFAC
jgi:hypothetical protein